MISREDLDFAILKLNQERCLKNMEHVRDEFIMKKQEFSLFQAEHFESMRRQIDIKRETTIQRLISQNGDQIDRLNEHSETMIRQIEETEERFRTNFNRQLVQPFTEINFENENTQIESIISSNQNIDIDTLKNKYSQYNAELNDAKWKLNIFEIFKQDLINSNKSVESKTDDNIGVLELSSTFLDVAQIENILFSSFGNGVTNKLKIFNINSKCTLKTLSFNLGMVTCMTTMLDTYKVVIACQNDNSIRIWDLIEDKCVKTFQGHSSQVLCLKVLPNGQLASGSSDFSIKLWSVISDQTNDCLFTLTGHYESITSLDYLETRNFLVSASEDKNIRVWNLKERQCERIISGHTDVVTCVKCFKGENGEEFICSGSHDYTIEIWNGTRGESLKTLIGHKHFVCDLELNRARDRLISSSSDKTVFIWNLHTYECITVLEFFVTGFKFSPYTDKLVCSTYYGNIIRIVDIDTKKCLKFNIDDSIKCMEICLC